MKTEYRGQRTEVGGRQTAARRAFAPFAVLGLLISVLCFAGGCGNSAQEQAFARAEQMEQQLTTETAPAVIAEYRRVAAMDPGSAIARKARARIEAVEAHLKAEEQHKNVFQEHGVD